MLGGATRETIGLVVDFFVERLGVRKREEPNHVCELDETASCVAAVEERDGIELETVRMDGEGAIFVERFGDHRERTHQSVHVSLNQIVVDVVVQDQFTVSTKVQTHLSLLVNRQKG